MSARKAAWPFQRFSHVDSHHSAGGRRRPDNRGLALAIVLPAAVLAAEAESEKGFTPIFNGKDLTGWEGEPGYWSVEDGAITGKTTAQKPLDHPSYLFWRGGKPADFELRATYRFQGTFGNSGINFRSQELPNWDVKGYQADMETGPTCTGTLYECNQRGDHDRPRPESGDRRRRHGEVTTLADARRIAEAHQAQRLERVRDHRPRAGDHPQDQRRRDVARDRPREGQSRRQRA